MGANGSTEAEELIRGKYGISNLAQGKPGIPEGIPKITDITHNSITLSWLSPVNSGKILAYQVECYNLKDKKWRIITSTCQGTCYHIKNLVPENRYMFRVRAENICGQSKPSHVSETITTYPETTNYLEVKPTAKLVRRHSHYLKIDSRVNSMLTRTEDSVDSGNSVGSIPFRRNSMRGSLPPSFRSKRNSVTTMLPGAKRENILNRKESRRSFDEHSVTEEEGLNIKRISTSSTEASSLFSSNSMTSIAEDEELRILYGQRDCQMCSDNDDTFSTTNSHSTTSSQCSSRSSHSSSSHHSCTHNSTLLQNINLNSNANLMQNLSDDTKIEYFSNTDKSYSKSSGHQDANKTNVNAGKTIFDICDNEIWEGRIDRKSERTSPPCNQNDNRNLTSRNTLDLRSLRQMLNSQDVMVKTLDSCTLDNMRRPHCVIKELDEDCLTMDIVSTI